MPTDEVVESLVENLEPAVDVEKNIEAEGAAAIAERDELEKVEKEEKKEAAPAAEPPPSAYSVNKKFKYANPNSSGKDDEQLEKEFDEWILPVIKDADTEKKVRDLYAAAHGIEFTKKERDAQRSQREKIEKSVQGIVQEIQQVSGHVRNRDYGRLFNELQINKQDIAKWLVEQHEVEEKLGALPEPVKKIYNEYGTLKETVDNLNREIEAMRAGSVDTAVQARQQELNHTLSSPDVAPIVQAFDARLGKAGAFEDFVMRHGRSEWELNKRDLSAREAVDEVLKYLGNATQAPSPVAKPNESAATKPTVIPAPKATVIPNVGSGSSSSAMKRPRSIEDLRKMSKAMHG